jgi:hypothetical protein
MCRVQHLESAAHRCSRVKLCVAPGKAATAMQSSAEVVWGGTANLSCFLPPAGRVVSAGQRLAPRRHQPPREAAAQPAGPVLRVWEPHLAGRVFMLLHRRRSTVSRRWACSQRVVLSHLSKRCAAG